jgi:hypothetical protein
MSFGAPKLSGQRSQKWFVSQQLPLRSTACPRGLTGHVALLSRSIETRLLPTLTRSYPRRFTFYVADPSAPLKLVRLPCSLAGALAA